MLKQQPQCDLTNQASVFAKANGPEEDTQHQSPTRTRFNLEYCGIQVAETLLSVRIENMLQLNDVSDLPRSVVDLKLHYTGITTLRSARNLPLIKLDISRNWSLASLDGCPQTVVQLNCSHNNLLNSLEALSSLGSLQVLFCRDTHVGNLRPLKHLTSLTTLDVSYSGTRCAHATGSGDLDGCPASLKYLKCKGPLWSSLQGLEECPNLERLDCSNSGVGDLHALADMQHLQRLLADDCPHLQAREDLTEFPECVTHFSLQKLNADPAASDEDIGFWVETAAEEGEEDGPAGASFCEGFSSGGEGSMEAATSSGKVDEGAGCQEATSSGRGAVDGSPSKASSSGGTIERGSKEMDCA
jgi:hypothetical protein